MKLFLLFSAVLQTCVSGQEDYYRSFTSWLEHVPQYLVSGFSRSVQNENGMILGAATIGSLVSLQFDQRIKRFALEEGLMPDRVSKFGYNLGGSYAYIFLLPAVWATGRMKNEERISTRKKLEFAVLTLTCTELTTAFLKATVKRTRPNGSTHPNFLCATLSPLLILQGVLPWQR